ncbi:ATP-binding protein [Bacillus pacificus]|uniref:ATP-binding protein n=1 Tax=Bacillus pacificus TaxID=2026187 RepID=UPI003590058B
MLYRILFLCRVYLSREPVVCPYEYTSFLVVYVNECIQTTIFLILNYLSFVLQTRNTSEYFEIKAVLIVIFRGTFYSIKEEGISLGLMVYYKIIEAHQGKVFIESEVNKGTIVEVTLPICTLQNYYILLLKFYKLVSS